VFGVDLRHQVCCPRVRSAQYDIGGVLLGVDFWPNGRWEDGVIFPADVAGPGDETPAP
jgi:hypothetical protein